MAPVLPSTPATPVAPVKPAVPVAPVPPVRPWGPVPPERNQSMVLFVRAHMSSVNILLHDTSPNCDCSFYYNDKQKSEILTASASPSSGASHTSSSGTAIYTVLASGTSSTSWTISTSGTGLTAITSCACILMLPLIIVSIRNECRRTR